MKLTRRAFSEGALAGLIGFSARRLPASGQRSFFAAHRLSIGLQLFPVLPDLRRNFGGALEAIAKIGYRDVELAGLLGHSATDFRAALDRNGLKCRAMHVPGQATFGPATNLTDDLATVITDAHTLGASDIVVPIFLMKDTFDPVKDVDGLAFLRAAGARLARDDYLRTAAFLNQKARILRESGLGLSYHNHNVEFAPIAGQTGLDILLAETDPRLVRFELDAGWAAAAGVDVISLLRAHPGRFTKMHVKDLDRSSPINFEMKQIPAELGRGSLDWPSLLPAAYAAGVRSFFVEQEAPFAGSRMDAMKANFQFLSEVKTTAPRLPREAEHP